MTDRAHSSWLWGHYSRTGLVMLLATLAADQAHKWWMLLVYRIEDKGQVAVLPFLDLVFVKNTGISYSLFDAQSYAWQLALSGFAAVASVALWVWLARAGTSRLMAWSIGLIIGGAIGNAIDRVILGGVADFFLAHAFGYSWYVFNIADAAIVAGVAGLLYDSVRSSRNDASNPL
jgi:signal peptidase II